MTQVRIQITTPRPPLWRVKHDIENGVLIRPNLPEMFPLFPNHYAQFPKEWQLLSYAMNQPWLTPAKWTALYVDQVWITNFQGFGNPDSPRANFVTGEDLTAALPRVEALTCGGNVLTGQVEGDELVVHVLDWRQAPPRLADLRPWEKTYGVIEGVDGSPRHFHQGLQPDGSLAPVVHPLLGDPSRYPRITIKLALLQPWTRTELPDPYTLYL